jgi:CDP-diacylglycerol---glycerol-3-phosphate 3-phosphatidyltransferase
MDSWFRTSWNYPESWNKDIRLTWHDRLIATTVLRLVPSWVVPNYLTALRFLLTPVVIWLLWRGNYSWGVALFIMTVFTDALDGSLARVRRQVSEWGILNDSIADKIFIGSTLALVVLKNVNPYLGMALLAVEIFLVAFGWWRARHGLIEPANIWGKIKMVAEVVGLTGLIIALWSGVDLLADVSSSTLGLALIAAMVSIFVRIK